MARLIDRMAQQRDRIRATERRHRGVNNDQCAECGAIWRCPAFEALFREMWGADYAG
jgi:NAD-dependent dihydropyrimidine dehydrogenase PreA subunit